MMNLQTKLHLQASERGLWCPESCGENILLSGVRGDRLQSRSARQKLVEKILLSFYFAKEFDRPPSPLPRDRQMSATVVALDKAASATMWTKLSCGIPSSQCLQLWVHNDARFNDD